MEKGLKQHIKEIGEVVEWRVIYFNSNPKDVRKIESALYQPDMHVVGVHPDNWPLSAGKIIDDISPKEGRYWRLLVPLNEVERAKKIVQKALSDEKD